MPSQARVRYRVHLPSFMPWDFLQLGVVPSCVVFALVAGVLSDGHLSGTIRQVAPAWSLVCASSLLVAMRQLSMALVDLASCVTLSSCAEPW